MSNQMETMADLVRPIGPLAAWIVGCFAGWRVWQTGDLLTSVLRGAAAWFAVMVIWRVFISLCDALAAPKPMSQQPADPRIQV